MLRLVWLVLVPLAAGCGSVVSASDAGDPVDAGLPDADPCDEALCECDIDADCGSFEVCDTSGPGRLCVCAPAYAADGDSCAFAGAPADPGFTAPDAWTSRAGHAVVDPNAPGDGDPGEGILAVDALCAFDALAQTFTMPPLDRAEPFRLAVTYKTTDSSFGGAQVTVGGASYDLPATNDEYQTRRICLGARAYGGPVPFIAGAGGAPGNCDDEGPRLTFDRVAIEVADPGECPEPGTIVNGDFEADEGWTFTTTQSGTGEIVAGAGEEGSRAGVLTNVNRCSSATMTTRISAPAAGTMAGQAIELFWTATAGSRVVAQVAGESFATLVGTGAPQQSRICLPSWVSGTGATLSFFFQRVSNNQCSTTLDASFTADNVRFVSEPACAGGELVDPGFEQVADPDGPATAWGLQHGIVNDEIGSDAELLDDPTRARTGSGVLLLTASNHCVNPDRDSNGARMSLIVPEADAVGGPAIRFFADVGVNPNSETRLRVDLARGPVHVMAEGGGYREGRLCLPPALAGRRVTARFSAGGLGGSCSPPFGPEIAFIDDVEIGTDASCP
jgi:hypothetical protein